MRLLHAAAKTHARFDDPNLVSHAGLVPAMRLAELVGLEELVAKHVRVDATVGANAGVKVGSLIAGMVAGADDIDGMDVVRHGAIPAVFGGIRAPSTLGSFLRAFDHGNVRQLAAVGRRVLAGLADRVGLLPGSEALAFIDIDSTQKRVYGPAKQGAAFGHTKIASKSLSVRGLNALAATVSTPLAAPVLACARLRGGNAASARGAASLVAESINTTRQAGVTGLIVVRADSAYYNGAFVSACRRNNAHFSVTAGMDPKIRRAITGIEETSWTAIEYPNAVFDEDTGEWISDAEIAEVPYTAFAAKKAHAVTARLIVRRVRRLPHRSKVSCSPPGATTRSSPTAR
ncbi:MAG TPA: IS1380 family transposase [Pseudonocardiaceae bacterium]